MSIAQIFNYIRSKFLLLLILSSLFFLSWRYYNCLQEAENNILSAYFNENISLVGVVIEEPDKRENNTMLTIRIENSQERVLITKWHYPEYEYGDKLKIIGKLQEPENFEGFDYKKYLWYKNIFGIMYQTEINLIAKDQANSVKKILFSIKNRLKDSLNRIIHMPESAFMEALLFGDESNISETWKEKLNMTGTRHIAAVSGMNITILVFILFDFLLLIGLWKDHAFYVSIFFIISYVSMTGASPSVVRAGIMSILYLLSQYFGRGVNGLRILVIALFFMLFSNPFLIHDIGFQLSFLALTGIIYVQPILFKIFKIFPKKFEIRNNLSGTLSAQVFTLPIIIYNFGRISLISPFSNILILPLLPFITIFGFIVAIFGMFSEELALILSWLPWFLLRYITMVIDWFYQFSFTSVVVNDVSPIFLIIFYIWTIWCISKFEKQKISKFLRF
ncbi:MAG: ComEC/Rec2 family competence protein [Patescibacteria group bacterium]